MPRLSGKCLCGETRFSVAQAAVEHHACHCRTCQRWAGGPLLATHVEDLQWESRTHLRTYDSSAWAQREFCGNCGSGLLYRLKQGDVVLMNVGLFDEVERFRLTSEIFIDHKPPGYDFAGDHPRETEAEVMAKHGG